MIEKKKGKKRVWTALATCECWCYPLLFISTSKELKAEILAPIRSTRSSLSPPPPLPPLQSTPIHVSLYPLSDPAFCVAQTGGVVAPKLGTRGFFLICCVFEN
jgi:hypothetical protein